MISFGPIPLKQTAALIARLKSSIAYLSIPTRPPALSWVKPPDETILTRLIDNEKISLAKNSRTIHPDYDYKSYNNCNWTFELDEALRLFENRAKEVGIMMTPVLIINEI